LILLNPQRHAACNPIAFLQRLAQASEVTATKQLSTTAENRWIVRKNNIA